MSVTIDPPDQIAVYLELGSKRLFASAVAWLGWCRSGKDERSVLEALAAAAPRYAARRIAWHVLDHVWEIEDRSG